MSCESPMARGTLRQERATSGKAGGSRGDSGRPARTCRCGPSSRRLWWRPGALRGAVEGAKGVKDVAHRWAGRRIRRPVSVPLLVLVAATGTAFVGTPAAEAAAHTVTG